MGTLVLLSGGLDSAVCAVEAKRAADLAGCLFLRWGQPMWDRERAASRRIAERLQVPWMAHDIQIGGAQVMSSGVGVGGPRMVGARNLIFLSVAASVALAIGADSVTIGCTADDYEHYPDCRPEFIKAADAMIGEVYGVRVRAPLLRLHKADLIRSAAMGGLLNDETWTCYESATAAPCGTCNACRLRADAIAAPKNQHPPVLVDGRPPR